MSSFESLKKDQIKKMGGNGSKERYDSKIFSAAVIKKNFGVYPLLALVAIQTTHVILMSAWMIYTRDCIWRRGTLPVNLKVDLLNPRRLKIYMKETELKNSPKLHEAYKMLREAEKDRDRKVEEMKKQSPKK